MVIHFSPYYSGKAYVDYCLHRGGLFDESIDSTSGLLSRLELLLGISWPDVIDERVRITAYYEAIDKVICTEDAFYRSFQIDREEAQLPVERRHYRVSTELLAWRDALILAGWDGLAVLPKRLSLLGRAERVVRDTNCLSSGLADRWKGLCGKTEQLKESVHVRLHCPMVLIPSTVLRAISPLLEEPVDQELTSSQLDRSRCRILQFDEQTEAYEWIAKENPTPDTLVVCRDGQRLDSVLRCMGAQVAAGRTQAEAHLVVEDVRCMLDGPKHLVWLDCTGDYGFCYPYHFLSREEIETVNDIANINIHSQEKMLDAVQGHIQSCLNMVHEDITLVYAKTDLGQILPEHPIMAALLHDAKKESQLTPSTPTLEIEKQEEKDVISFVGSSELCVGRNVAIGPKTMSYSSLDKLVQSPFNYAVEKYCEMREEGDADLQTEKGNVAHKVVQLMVEAGGLNIEGLETFLQEAIEEEGNYLKLEEYRFERENFAFFLKQSITSLKEIIESQKLEIVKSEKTIEGKLDDFGPSIAKIDLLLKDQSKEDEYVIFDFKYSDSDYNPNKLQENKSVQFAFYQKIFDKCSDMGKVVAMGYYLLPLGTLFVPEGEMGSDRLSGKGIQVVPRSATALDNPLAMLKQSYDFRMKQLEEGRIEEGEGMALEGLQYNGEGVKDRFPLSADWNDKQLKSHSYGNPHIVLKNQIR